MRKKFYTRNVGVLLTEDSYQRLVDITDNLEVTISAYIRDLLQKEIDQKEENLNA
ncbi:hypothetical protein [Desulfatitalea tepidiphila]|uniref:hypothetical protein n=1 Tax=Desulfatitalea tepidiphila TaxID=1185843 RepID=UPI0013792E86|nr:hypothetical protein [Desulfatitalea tepidiphila]